MTRMTRARFRTRAIGLASLFAFLLLVGSSPFALAASDWPTWPPKKTDQTTTESPAGTIGEESVKEGVPAAAPAAEAASKAGAAAGKSTFAGISSGTLGWAAAIVGAGVLIGVAAGSGGGGSTSNH